MVAVAEALSPMWLALVALEVQELLLFATQYPTYQRQTLMPPMTWGPTTTTSLQQPL
jgi:hypothetical protein